MLTVGERIKWIRSKEELSTRAFGDRIGISSAAVTLIEKGKNNPSEQTIRAICTEFRIRRDWLEDGDGDPELPEAEDDFIIDQEMWQKSPHIRALTKSFVKKFGWDALEELLALYHEQVEKELQTKKDPVE